MRLIDGDALFKQLKDIYDMIGAGSEELHFSLNDMEMNIASMETIQPEQQWIPVTERLPEEKTYVLILADTIAGKMVKVSFIYKDSAGRNCWTTLDEYGKNLFDWQPTHWMPVPEPWKGENK